MLNFEILKVRVLWQHRLQQLPEPGNIPLVVTQFIEGPPLGIFRFQAKGLVERPARRDHLKRAVQDKQWFPDRVYDTLRKITGGSGFGFDCFEGGNIIECQHDTIDYIIQRTVR